MKPLLVAFIVLMIPSLAYSQSNCDCWEKKFQKQQLNYNTVISDMEQAFIAKGYLKDSKPSSYIELADSIIAKNEYFIYDVKINPLLIKEFSSCFVFDSCDQAHYKKFKKMTNKIERYRDINPTQTYSDFKKIFKKTDFEQLAVRHYFLTFYSATALNIPTGLKRKKLPPPTPKSNEVLAPRNLINVYVAPNDTIYIRDQPIEFQELKKWLINIISDSSESPTSPEMKTVEIEGLGKRQVSKLFIRLLYKRATSYKLYVEVQEELQAAYKELRNGAGIKEFGKSYEQMLKKREKYEKEIKIIRKLVPQQMLELSVTNEY